MRTQALFLLPVAIALSGCAGWVVFGHTIEDKPATPVQQPAISPQQPVISPQPSGVASPQQAAVNAQPAEQIGHTLKGVTVTFTPEARQKINADRRFKEDALVAAVENELRARHLLDPGATGAGHTIADRANADRAIEIVIDDFATRPATNAVVFGYLLGEGTLTGTIDVRGASGEQLQAFRIEADSRLATSADGTDEQPLRPLYRKFANLTVSNLSGAPRKSDDSTNTEVPR
jgi:hypothetical protein